jgi:hypothetical protein
MARTSGPWLPRRARFFRESLVHNGSLYVGTNTEIKQFDLSGNELPRFNGADAINYLAPFADGSIAGANVSGEIFHFEPNGSVRQRLQFSRLVFPASGIDVDRDQCSVRYATMSRVATWNACTNADPLAFDRAWSTPPEFARAFRILPQGGFLVALLTDLAGLDSSGRIVRRYGIPARALALDINGTSFWTGAGGTLVKVSIETGQIEQLVNTGQAIDAVSVVGEPRVALSGTNIPTIEPRWLVLLVACFGMIAVLRIR